MNKQLLGGMKPAQFLKEYWQKKPLLIRNALNKYTNLITKPALQQLAMRDDVQSRIVRSDRGEWLLDSGPFSRRDFAKLKGAWTLLVQSVNHYLPEAHELLQQFKFIPYARLDDLMISYAPDGGGVGPHFDSYDVFLLQGHGQRLWQIAKQKNRELIPGAPLRILKNFKPEQEWVLEPGDMLYLPPNYAHNGIALGECMTYSIGFRAASYQELAQGFLMHLLDHCQLEGIYADPKLKLSQHPAQISTDMIDQVTKVLKKIKWDKKTVEQFLGKYLTEPKPQVFLNLPEIELSQPVFQRLALRDGVRLTRKSQLLFTTGYYFLNGESYPLKAKSKKFFQELANTREIKLTRQQLKDHGDMLYNAYLDGALEIRR